MKEVSSVKQQHSGVYLDVQQKQRTVLPFIIFEIVNGFYDI